MSRAIHRLFVLLLAGVLALAPVAGVQAMSGMAADAMPSAMDCSETASSSLAAEPAGCAGDCDRACGACAHCFATALLSPMAAPVESVAGFDRPAVASRHGVRPAPFQRPPL